MAFRVIAAEAIAKNLRPDEILSYAADRLKELGKEIEKISGSTTSQAQPAATQVTKLIFIFNVKRKSKWIHIYVLFTLKLFSYLELYKYTIYRFPEPCNKFRATLLFISWILKSIFLKRF
jgi:hypothetical protein